MIVERVVQCLVDLTCSVDLLARINPCEHLEVDGVVAKVDEDRIDIFDVVLSLDALYCRSDERFHLSGIGTVSHADGDDGELITVVLCQVLLVFREEL